MRKIPRSIEGAVWPEVVPAGVHPRVLDRVDDPVANRDRDVDQGQVEQVRAQEAEPEVEYLVGPVAHRPRYQYRHGAADTYDREILNASRIHLGGGGITEKSGPYRDEQVEEDARLEDEHVEVAPAALAPQDRQQVEDGEERDDAEVVTTEVAFVVLVYADERDDQEEEDLGELEDNVLEPGRLLPGVPAVLPERRQVVHAEDQEDERAVLELVLLPHVVDVHEEAHDREGEAHEMEPGVLVVQEWMDAEKPVEELLETGHLTTGPFLSIPII